MIQDKDQHALIQMEKLARFASNVVRGMSGTELSWRQRSDLKQARVELGFVVRDLDAIHDDLVLSESIIEFENEREEQQKMNQPDSLKERLARLRRDIVAQVVELTGLSEQKITGLVHSFEYAKDLRSRQMRVSASLGLDTYFPQDPNKAVPLGSVPSGHLNADSLPWNAKVINWPSAMSRSHYPEGVYEIVPVTEPLDVRVFYLLNSYLCQRSELITRERQTAKKIEIARRRLARLTNAA